jgi:amidohydrolase
VEVTNKILDAVRAEVDKIGKELLSLSHAIFNNPEPAFKETLAAGLLEDYAKSKGFTVSRGEGGLATALKGVCPGKPGKKIAFLSEYDALPIGHACGHNLIAASGIGAAVVFKRIADEYDLPANTIFLGTPAEEGGGGKILMINEGFFKDIDYAMMIHPADRTMVEDWSLAGQWVVSRYYGRAAHCAASPWLGANAQAAAEQTLSLINAWRLQFRDYSRVNAIIKQGGKVVNVIPDYAELEIQVRSDNKDYLRGLIDIVLNCSECAAKAFGVRTEHEFPKPAYDPINNSPVIEHYMKKSFEALGEIVMPRMRTHGIGCTDMGNVSQVIPAIHGHLKLIDENTHTEEFMAAAGGEYGNTYVPLAAKAMAMTAVYLVLDPDGMENKGVKDE